MSAETPVEDGEKGADEQVMTTIPIGDLDHEQALVVLQVIVGKFADGLEQDAITLRSYGHDDQADALLRLRARGIGYVAGAVEAAFDGRLKPRR